MSVDGELRVLVAYAPKLEDATTSELHGNFVHLQNPKTGCKALYLLTNDSVQEVHWFKQRYGSWFVGDSVIEDGSLYLASPVDPLFLLLPILDRARMKSQEDGDQGKFRALEEILDVDGYPVYSRLYPLLQACLLSVCDVREIGSTKYYRLDDSKALAWLCCKVQQTCRALESIGGSWYASLSEDDLRLHAVGMLGEYLRPDPWFERLCSHLRVDVEASKKARREVQPNTFSAVSIKEAPVRANVKTNANKKAPQGTSGTRKITSFFGRPR